MALTQTRMTSTTIAVLEVLLDGENEDLHGLEICRRTGLKSGTVYPIMDRLRRGGWVNARWEDDADWQNEVDSQWRPRRRYYRLTKQATQFVGAAAQARRDSRHPRPGVVLRRSPATAVTT
jgi:PadR family transcriptional regulator PadR